MTFELACCLKSSTRRSLQGFQHSPGSLDGFFFLPSTPTLGKRLYYRAPVPIRLEIHGETATHEMLVLPRYGPSRCLGAFFLHERLEDCASFPIIVVGVKANGSRKISLLLRHGIGRSTPGSVPIGAVCG
jgi:hypothetical protein